ncbi:glycosyltransferase [Thiomicrorhabdus sp. 6S2-11]|uniref:Glycosyltransferase n=1 Tax=Thiomicrorhabdus marina TaxID=2818442 RepID=A0ABS3Q1V5_9GAMM|nr:glycosyltransferase [Thiomicrorhabdus marina]MBO1926321.1 glycosyltransferase [Thiomicrorhabdus marina]
MDKLIKVVQINAVYGVSSTGRNCLELAEAAKNHGIEMHSAYAIEGPFAPENGTLIGDPLDRKIHALYNRLTGLQGYASGRATKKFIHYLEQVKPHIIHLNNLHSNFINLELLFQYIQANSIAVIITLHDCWFYTGRCVHYTVDNCHKWQDSCGNCPRLKKDNPSWIFDRSTKMLYDKKHWLHDIKNLTVIGVSDWITNEAKQSPILEKAEFKRIYNWIDTDVFKPETEKKAMWCKKWEVDPSTFIVLAVASNWSLDKGLAKFNQLRPLLDNNFLIVLIGNLPQDFELYSGIVNIAETHDVRELSSLYSSADAYLNLSTEESFGKVIAESLSCGTPVITSKKTANPELVVEGRTGYIVDTNDKVSVIASLNKIKSETRKSYSKECREFALANFNIYDRVLDYMKLYKSIGF